MFILLLGMCFFSEMLWAAPTDYVNAKGRLPDEWYILPEDRQMREKAESASPPASPPASEEEIGNLVQKIYDTDISAMEPVGEGRSWGRFSSKGEPPPEDRPPDWVPWHFELFTSDLLITVQGMIGVMTMNNQPAVQVFWRKVPVTPTPSPSAREESSTAMALPIPAVPQPEPQFQPTSQSPLNSLSHSGASALTSASLSPEMTGKDISVQIEPAIRAALATGKIKNETNLRTNMSRMAGQFQSWITALNADTKRTWWPYQFRIDFMVTASGHVAPAFSTGADFRFRFEWDRVYKKGTKKGPEAPSIRPKSDVLQNSLLKFTSAMEKTLEEVIAETPEETGLRPAAFRVGIGVTANGTIGIAKGSGTILGHLYFKRILKSTPGYEAGKKIFASNDPIAIIEKAPPEHHTAFATSNEIPYETLLHPQDGAIEHAIYKVGQDRIKRGLLKAIKIGNFFTRRATASKSSKWKVYQLRADYDVSITGGFGLANVGSWISSEVIFQDPIF